jgi:MFS family permease
MFVVSGAIGPIAGVILSGFVFSRVGGYNSLRALTVFQVFTVMGVAAAIASVFVRSSYGVMVCLCIEGICGGVLLPAATGVMLDQVPPSMRTAANSLANLSYNLFGYVPAPYLYGQFQQSFGGRAGMAVIQSFCILAALLLFTFTIRKHVKYEKSQRQHSNPQGAESIGQKRAE